MIEQPASEREGKRRNERNKERMKNNNDREDDGGADREERENGKRRTTSAAMGQTLGPSLCARDANTEGASRSVRGTIWNKRRQEASRYEGIKLTRTEEFSLPHTHTHTHTQMHTCVLRRDEEEPRLGTFWTAVVGLQHPSIHHTHTHKHTRTQTRTHTRTHTRTYTRTNTRAHRHTRMTLCR
eukprot:GHVU01053218.1.p2 GENE.GHVU01053218.1~~GHVU01053218.1.p2  ORF type:complete len:183 (-),score=31.05 GHVU01053218.1:144-692(-)